MTPQEISLIVVLVVIAAYVIAALLSRSKSGGEAPADIMLEARLPQSAKSIDALIPPADRSVMKNTKKKRRKSAPSPELGANERPAARTQQHHASPKPLAKSDAKPELKEKVPPAAAEPARSVAAPAPKPQPKPQPKAKPEPVLEEIIDPELTGQISELDNRLDAIEELVASIEESLASFEPIEEAPAGEVRAA